MSKAETKQPEAERIVCAQCELASLELSADGQWLTVQNRHHGSKHQNRYPAAWLVEWLTERLKAAGSNPGNAR